MSNTTKYEIVNGDEEIAMTGVHARYPEKSSIQKREAATGTSVSSRPRRLKGALKILGFLLLAVLIVVGALAATFFHFAHHIKHAVEEFVIPQLTTDQPLNLPKVILPRSEMHDLKHELREFHHALHHGKKPKHGDLILTEREINGLICGHDEGDDDMCGHVHAAIEDNAISVKFSFPAEDAPGGKGRYFVGEKHMMAVPMKAEKKASSDNFVEDTGYAVQTAVTVTGPKDDFTLFNSTGYIDIENVYAEVKSAELFGWMATDAFVTRFLEGKNWADHMCPEAEKALGHIAGITIGNGKVIVHVK